MKVEKEEVIAGVTGAGIGVASVGVSYVERSISEKYEEAWRLIY